LKKTNARNKNVFASNVRKTNVKKWKDYVWSAKLPKLLEKLKRLPPQKQKRIKILWRL